MNKSLVLKNKIILYFSFLITFFITIYLIYFIINGQRGLLKYLYLTKQNQEFNEKFLNLKVENKYYINRIKRLDPNTIDLDFLDEQVREKLGFIDKNEKVIILK